MGLHRHMIKRAALTVLVCAHAAGAQSAGKGVDFVDLFRGLAIVHCVDRGPSPVLVERDSFESFLRFPPAAPEIRQRVDSLARFWDGPSGCRALPSDSLMRMRQRRDSIDVHALRTARIQAIGDLRWSASEAEVVEHLGGTPGRTRDAEYGNTVLVWLDRDVIGEKATLTATVDDRVGLVAMAYVFHPETSGHCSRLFSELRTTLAQKIPSEIKPREVISNRSVTGMDQCEAVSLQRGTAMVQWADSLLGPTILLGVSAKGSVLLTYETSIARRVREAAKWAERKKAF